MCLKEPDTATPCDKRRLIKTRTREAAGSIGCGLVLWLHPMYRSSMGTVNAAYALLGRGWGISVELWQLLSLRVTGKCGVGSHWYRAAIHRAVASPTAALLGPSPTLTTPSSTECTCRRSFKISSCGIQSMRFSVTDNDGFDVACGLTPQRLLVRLATHEYQYHRMCLRASPQLHAQCPSQPL